MISCHSVQERQGKLIAKKREARAKPLYCSLNYCVFDVPVAFAVVVSYGL